MQLLKNRPTNRTIDSLYTAVRGGYEAWARTPLNKRIQTIERFSALLTKNREELATILTQEMGKPIVQARNEIDGACSRIRFFTEETERWLTPQVMRRDRGVTEKLVYEPLGVIANISAWNYPYLVGVNVFIPALLGGNGVLYKPSSITEKTGFAIETLLYEAGVPREAFAAIGGSREVAAQLLDLPLDGYFFTGSTATGQKIMQKVHPKLVPVGLELGGKDPLYVTNQVASISQVAAAAADGAFYNNGQSCCSVERIYVHKASYDVFCEAFIKEVQGFIIGDPMDEKTYIGYLAQPSHIQFLNDQIDEAVSKGAKIVHGGPGELRTPAQMIPTVLTDVNHTMKLMREESFGPVIGIQKVADDDEAIHMMNDTHFGLTAAVYTDDLPRGEAILSKVNAGTVYLNCCDRVTPYLPWSGRKESGIGSTLSYLGILAFVRPKGYQMRACS